MTNETYERLLAFLHFFVLAELAWAMRFHQTSLLQDFLPFLFATLVASQTRLDRVRVVLT